MNRTKNQRGFGAVEIIILVVILAIIGVGGWYVWQSQNNSNPSVNNPNSQTETTKNTQTFSDERLPFAFEYPKEWVIKVDEKIREGQPLPDKYSIFLNTKDIAYTEMPIGGSEVSVGVKVNIVVSKSTLNSPQGVFTGLRASAQGKTNVTVSGLPAVEYEFGYESQPGRYVDFIKDGRLYSVSYFSAGNERSSVDFEGYKALISSFDFK
jgi:hypothetical protein